MTIGECPACKAMTIGGNCISTECVEARKSFQEEYKEEVMEINERKKRRSEEAIELALEQQKEREAERKKAHEERKRAGERFWEGVEPPGGRLGKWFGYLRTEHLNVSERGRSIYVIEVDPKCGLEKRFGSSIKWKDLGLGSPRGFFYVGHTGKPIEQRYVDHMKGHKSNVLNMLCKADGSPNFEDHCRKWTEKFGFERMIPYDERDDWESYVGWSLAQDGYVVFGPHDARPKEEFPYL